jgi:hypothetical protein
MGWQVGWRLAGRTPGEGWVERYFGMHSRTLIWSRVLLLRFDDRLTPRERRLLARMARAERSRLSMAWLALRSLRPLWGADEAFGRELIVLSSSLWCRLVDRRARRAARLTPAPKPAEGTR